MALIITSGCQSRTCGIKRTRECEGTQNKRARGNYLCVCLSHMGKFGSNCVWQKWINEHFGQKQFGKCRSAKRLPIIFTYKLREPYTAILAIYRFLKIWCALPSVTTWKIIIFYYVVSVLIYNIVYI